LHTERVKVNMDKNSLSVQIGEQLRYFRQQRNLTLEDLADLTGVSKPMIGQIERGTSNPTVSTLWKIAAGLQIPFASFITTNPSVKIKKVEEQPFFTDDDNLFEVYNTFSSPGIPVEIYRIRLLPGCMHFSERSGSGTVKSITVYSGRLTVKIGEEDSFTINNGDSVSFTTDNCQVYENTTKIACEINMVIYYSRTQVEL
jgi:XRE family transcriptional regulator, regulator of sulfur utilization